MDHVEAKARERAIWGEGNYPEIAKLLEPAARALVDACAISAGQEVLDVAAGTGNAALLAAREGASVVASDLAPGMVARGRDRSRAEGVAIEWVEADVEELPFEDGRFDCATSVFGAMFAPRPDAAARELFRVVRPGGSVGMANWTPASFAARMFAVATKYGPAPERPAPASVWGDDDAVRERFGGLGGSVELDRRALRWEFESLDEMREFFELNAPPWVAARAAMPAADYESMMGETLELAREASDLADDRVGIDVEYLLVVARKRG